MSSVPFIWGITTSDSTKVHMAALHPEQLDRLGGVTRLEHGVAVGRQEPAEADAHAVFVVDEQDGAGGGRGHGASKLGSMVDASPGEKP